MFGVLDIHLGVEDAGRSFDNTDSLVECRNRENVALRIHNDSSQLQLQVGGVHLSCKCVSKTLCGAGRHLSVVLDGCQVANNLRRLTS